MASSRRSSVRRCDLLLGFGNVRDPGIALGHRFPPTYFWNHELVAANERLQRETNGRLSIVLLPTSPEARSLQQLQDGALDIAWVATTGLEVLLPKFGALHAPFLTRNVEQAAKLLETPTALSLLDQLPEQGLIGRLVQN
jgi:TRAP-type C4-dicarboxylate transport system substrate-binding protein